MAKKVVLIIMDGWGHGDKTRSDAIFNASTPFIDSLYQSHPNAELLTDGEHVGLPPGQMGNSEVGHLNIGSGRIVLQYLPRINKTVEDGTIDKDPTLLQAFEHAKTNQVAVHFMGLVSDGGVHSHQQHLHKLCDMANDYGLPQIYVHAFTDGRDRDPHSGLGFINELQKHLYGSTAELVSVIGRYYAMDRDKRWERLKLAYDMLLEGKGEAVRDFPEAIQRSYDEDVTDEFFKPMVKVDDGGNPIGRIRENDVVICFNFRTDRCREITTALTQKDMPEHGMHTLPLYYVTLTNYDDTFRDIHVVSDKEHLHLTLGELMALAGKKQIRISETEKYAHVTYFFSGGREKEFKGEQRILINSPGVPTYDMQPEMSAPEVRNALVKELQKGTADFVCLNFANADMVGHTGDYDAILKALETVDQCTKDVVEAGLENGYSFVILADHGNADHATNEDGSPNTAHSTNPVPVFILDEGVSSVSNGILADVAPTILSMMDMEIPGEMTGRVLVAR